MLKRIALFGCDLASVGLATLLALLLRDNFETSVDQLVAFLPYLGSTVAVAAIALVIMGLNRGVWRLSVMHDYLRIVGAAILTVSVAMALGFLTNRLENVSRSLPVIELILIIFSLVGLRVLARLFFSWRNNRKDSAAAIPDFSRSADTVLIVGVNRLTNLYLRSVDDLARGSVRIAGLLASQKSYQGRSIGPHKVLGAPIDAGDVIRLLGVHGVFVTRIVVMLHPGDLDEAERDRLEQAAAKHDVPLQYFAETLGFPQVDLAEKPRATQGSQGTENSDTLWRHALRPYWVVKRLIDCTLAIVLLVLLAPLFGVVAAAVAFDVGFPIIFWQQRPGARGVPFAVYKFRTMGISHDALGRRLSDTARISAIGKFLRASRLDELPQLFNVLIGSMSFVGPRPLLPVDQFPGLEARLAIPPGITGWAQVNGGREITAADKAAMDIWYLKHASLWIDIKICALTLQMIHKGERSNPQAIAAAWDELRSPHDGLASRASGEEILIHTQAVPPPSQARETQALA